MKLLNTIADTLVDYFYKFEKIELDEKYKIRITLNDEMIEYTDEFIVAAEDIKEFPFDSVEEELFSQLQWFKKGKYYTDMLWMSDKNISFDLYTDREQLNVYPNPVLTMCTVEFAVESKGQVKLELSDLKLNTIASLLNKELKPGWHFISIDTDNLEDGLYILKLNTDGKTYYCPFLKGRKGAP